MYRFRLFLMGLDKKKRYLGFVFIIVILLVTLLVIFRIDISGDENGLNNLVEPIYQKKVVLKEEKIKDSFSNIKELHWDHMPLKYKIVNPMDCNADEISEIKKAFKVIENATDNLVSFEETREIPDIKLECIKSSVPKELEGVKECRNITFNYYKESPSFYKEGYLSRFTQALTSSELLERSENRTVYRVCYIYGNYNPMTLLAEEIMPTISENFIKNATVNLYLYGGSTRCIKYPVREVHEILHGLGFGHSVSSGLAKDAYEALQTGYYVRISREEATKIVGDTMYPNFNCIYQLGLDEKYTSCLKKIYSNGEFEGNCSGVNFLV